MNKDLAELLDRMRIQFEAIAKAEKVKLLSRWSSQYSLLLRSARQGGRVPSVHVDNVADEKIRRLKAGCYYILPDDGSGMPSVLCYNEVVPDLSVLLSDTFTKCDEIIVLDFEFNWSCVLVNHGAVGVGRYYMRSD